MKKLFLYQCAIALVFVSLSRAANKQYCMHLTNFCDSLTLASSQGHVYGGWDFSCVGDWSINSVIGNGNQQPRELTTRPVDYDDDLFAYSVQFSLEPNNLFTLWGTDGFAHLGLFTFQTDQPFTLTKGACKGTDVDIRKPRLTASINQRKSPQVGQPLRCMHFKNFCDTIVLTGAMDGSKVLAYGNWDFQCTGDWIYTSIIGYARAGHELATRPGIPYQYISPYSTEFSFKAGRLFDLYETAGVGEGVFTARTNEPYSVTDGACSQSDINGKRPRLLDH